MPNSLWPHELQHTRFLCPSLSPRDCSNLCPLSQWCHPTCSFFVTPFSSCPQSFLASGSFPMSRFFASGGRSIGASASASVLPMNVQCWFPLGWTGLISLLSKGLSRIFSNTMVWTHQFFSAQPCLWSNSHICTWLLKNQNFDYMGFVCKVVSLVFNIMSRSVIQTDCISSKRQAISWLQSPSTVTLELQRRKYGSDSTFYPSICHEVMRLDAMILIFWMLSFKPAFSVSSFTFIKRLFSSSSLSASRYHLHVCSH